MCIFKTRIKRKVVVVDSDDEPATSDCPHSSPLQGQFIQHNTRLICLFAFSGRKKKPRMSALSSDEEDGDDAVSTFSTRLSRFKKSPVKSCSFFTLFQNTYTDGFFVNSTESTPYS